MGPKQEKINFVLFSFQNMKNQKKIRSILFVIFSQFLIIFRYWKIDYYIIVYQIALFFSDYSFYTSAQISSYQLILFFSFYTFFKLVNYSTFLTFLLIKNYSSSFTTHHST